LRTAAANCAGNALISFVMGVITASPNARMRAFIC
jgi:hypothetical protein